MLISSMKNIKACMQPRLDKFMVIGQLFIENMEFRANICNTTRVEQRDLVPFNPSLEEYNKLRLDSASGHVSIIKYE